MQSRDRLDHLIHSCERKAATTLCNKMFYTAPHSKLLCFLCAIFFWNFAIPDENRPYEFSFHIVDFQHRYEKKDTEGLITGEYGFITADGVYHETGYATDKNGDFIITRMTHRRIKSLKDAEEIFKDRPEAAKKLVEAVARACSSCKISVKSDNLDKTTHTTPVSTASASRMKAGPMLQQMINSLEEKKTDSPRGKNTVPQNPKDASNERRGKSLVEGFGRSMIDSTKQLVPKDERVYAQSKGTETNQQALRNSENDLYYRFNYTITSHEHQENGYRNGEKDGNYRAQSENGVDTRVKYLSNEFGYQPNVSFVPSSNAATEHHKLKGYSFLWYWS